MELLLLACAALGANVDTIADFADGSMQGWTPKEGSWRVEDGALVHEDPHFRGGLAARPGVVLDDFRFEAQVQIQEVYWDTETVWAGLLLRASDPLGQGAWRDGYLFLLRTNGEAVLTAPDGNALATKQTDHRPQEDAVRLKVTAKGKEIRCFVNGVELCNVENARYSVGEVALVNFGNVTSFDDVRLSGTTVPRVRPQAVSHNPPKPLKCEAVTPLPRIQVRDGANGRPAFYVKGTGDRFVPRGFNHTVLEEHSAGWHATFNTDVYDTAAMDATLERMAALGANVIRVWIWGTQKETGFTGDAASRGLNGVYMENVADFLRRATKHGIYVMPIFDETPHNAYYDYVAAEAGHGIEDRAVTGYNRQYLTAGLLAAKCAAAADFVRYIEEADPGLLPTVLGWALANEIFVDATAGPFREPSGEALVSTGKRYSMASDAARRRCYDEAILHWANALSGTIKDVDPEALVTAGMWTSDAHGREPANGLPDDGKDPRIPPRPSVLGGAGSRLDFIDVHIYPWDGTSKVRASAHERDAVVKAAIVGEYGVFKRNTAEEARVMMREMLEQAYAMGYVGDLHWVWDLTMVKDQTWSSIEEDLGAYVMGIPRPGVTPTALSAVLPDPLPDPYVFRRGGHWYVFGTARYCFVGESLDAASMRRVDLDFDFAGLPSEPQLWGLTPYCHDDGAWHLYATLHLGEFKTVVAHFEPAESALWEAGKPITHWRFDKILVGDLDKEDWFHYESKVLREADGSLYLVYASCPGWHQDVHILAQRLRDPATVDPDSPPHPILSPEGFRSEDRNPGYKQIVEGANVTRIGDTYVLLYSVGDFAQDNYKLGIAYSDVLVPPPGKTYRKVLLPDEKGIWGNTGKAGEVLYLLQSEKPEWPNYAGAFVRGPGLGNIVETASGYELVFHGHRPDADRLDPDRRRVWKLPLEVGIDPGTPQPEWIRAIL